MSFEHKGPAALHRPRLILLGEFSAGKSTLANALLRVPASPMRVTATHLPPIWYIPGDGPPEWVDADGTAHPVPNGDLSRAPLDRTRHLRIAHPAPFLQRFEILDMPGSSDPNLSADIWDGLVPEADLAVWCTPAAQAWRQSEAALWAAMPDDLRARGVLVVTRFDNVSNEADRVRVLSRLKRETAGAFAAVYPVSMTQAVLSDPSAEVFRAAGLAALEDGLIHLADGGVIGAAPAPDPPDLHPKPAPPDTTLRLVLPRRVTAQPRTARSGRTYKL